jgi:hypothetical protein
VTLDSTSVQVADLKTELKARGLSDTGLKPVLVARLKEALAGDGGGGGGGGSVSAPASSEKASQQEAADEPSPKKQRKGDKGKSDPSAEVRACAVRMHAIVKLRSQPGQPCTFLHGRGAPHHVHCT